MEEGEIKIPQINPDNGTPKPGFLARPKAFLKRRKKLIIGFFAIVIIFLLILIVPTILVYRDARGLLTSVSNLEKAVKEEQNIVRVKEEIQNVRQGLLRVKRSYKFLVWTKPIPLLGGYYRDGEAALNAGVSGMEAADVIMTAVEPYADIIGFTGSSVTAKSGEESANDRIEFIVESIKDIIPKLDEISQKVKVVQTEINKISPSRYPVRFAGREVRSKVVSGISLVDEAAEAVANSKPLLEMAPYFLGIDGERTYLLIFQNDKELRPTGGFITAYAFMTVNKGKVQPGASNDIYNLDLKYKPTIPAPQPIIDYIKGPYILSKNLRLRDMNWSGDFKESMDLFITEAKKVGINDVDGVVAVDTQVVVNILGVLGQIGVPGFGNFSTEIVVECNCPQVIHELESFADNEGAVIWDPLTGKILQAPRGYGNRKEIVGPLMNSILSNALGQPKEKLPDLFQAGWRSLTEKHVLFYMFDKKAQEAVEAFNIAGRVKNFEGDYLYINDANLGGRKSNLYVTQEVNQEIKVAKDGSVEKTLVITYNNPQAQDGWLNSVLPNWTRIYVPKGSQLLEVDGFEDKGEVYEELGKTVFSGGFRLRPQGLKKITVKYKLPFKVKNNYDLLVQKQPGLDSPLYTIELGKQSEEVFLKTDKEFHFRI